MREPAEDPAAEGRPGAHPAHPARVVALVLAAGAGHRFDPDLTAAKLVATVGPTPVLVQAVRRVLDVFGHCHVVLREAWRKEAHLTAVAAQLLEAGATLHICPDAERGMGRSLAFGVSCLLDDAPDAVLVGLGDMPWVAPDTLRTLRDLPVAPALIAAPVHEGHRGHPVLFGRAHLPALASLDGDEGARELLRRHTVTAVPVIDPGVLRDIDERADLASDVAEDVRADPDDLRPGSP